jgi:hypothetical protein
LYLKSASLAFLRNIHSRSFARSLSHFLTTVDLKEINLEKSKKDIHFHGGFCFTSDNEKESERICTDDCSKCWKTEETHLSKKPKFAIIAETIE